MRKIITKTPSLLFVVLLIGCVSPEIHPVELTVDTAQTNVQLDTAAVIDTTESVLDNIILDTATIGPLEASLIAHGLVDIQALDSTILVDLKYSGTENFTGIDLYGNLEKAYLQEEIAEQLVLAQHLLRAKYPAYSLLVYDATRPISAQWKMWKSIDMPVFEKTKFLANPRNGSIHNYGAAVDLTIANEYGDALDMGTPYDDPDQLAYPRLEQQFLDSGLLTMEIIENRNLLREVMMLAGFSPITTEWWHFNGCSRKEAKSRYEPVQ